MFKKLLGNLGAAAAPQLTATWDVTSSADTTSSYTYAVDWATTMPPAQSQLAYNQALMNQWQSSSNNYPNMGIGTLSSGTNWGGQPGQTYYVSTSTAFSSGMWEKMTSPAPVKEKMPIERDEHLQDALDAFFAEKRRRELPAS